MRDFGVDTVRLLTSAPALRIAPDAALDLERGRVNQRTGEVLGEAPLYTDLDGVTVSGKFARISTPDFQFSILPGGNGSVPYAKLQMSAAAYAEDNLSLSNADSLHDAMRRAECELAAFGIGWSLARAPLFTVALTRQAIPTQAIPHCMAAISSISGGARARKSDYGDTGTSFGNKQRSQTFYDKRREMREHGKDHARCPERLLRGEATLKRGRAVRDAFGAEAMTIPDLCRRFDKTPAVYFSEMQRAIFNPRNELPGSSGMDWRARLRAARLSPRPVAALARDSWAIAFVAERGLRGAELLIEEEYSGRDTRDTRAELLRHVRAASTQLELEKLTPSGVSRREIYEELKSKFLAPLALAA